MNRRIQKKKQALNRAEFIADKIGTIERGIWVDYFIKHPTDLPKVLKKLSTQGYKSILKHDVRTAYHSHKYSEQRCNWTFWQLEKGDFSEYVRLCTLSKLSYNLTCVPIPKGNPYGINDTWSDGRIRSQGVKYDN